MSSGLSSAHLACFSSWPTSRKIASECERCAKRERRSYPKPHRESIGDAISTLRDRGATADDLQALLDRIHIELVFTAHPTEAKRRSLRSKLRSIRGILASLDSNQLLPSEEESLRSRLRGELIKLWETNLIRPNRPTVEIEVHRGLSFQPALWATVPRIFGTLRTALAEQFPDAPLNYAQATQLRHVDRRRPRRAPIRHAACNGPGVPVAPRCGSAVSPSRLPSAGGIAQHLATPVHARKPFGRRRRRGLRTLAAT